MSKHTKGTWYWAEPTRLVYSGEIEFTPEDVARMFAEMSSDEQARFFNEVGRVASDWPGKGWPIQLEYITQDDGLNDRGRYVMATIGDYSHWGIHTQIKRKVCDEGKS